MEQKEQEKRLNDHIDRLNKQLTGVTNDIKDCETTLNEIKANLDDGQKKILGDLLDIARTGDINKVMEKIKNVSTGNE